MGPDSNNKHRCMRRRLPSEFTAASPIAYESDLLTDPTNGVYGVDDYNNCESSQET